VNLTAARRISWEHENSCTSDLDEEMERWQNQLQEVTTLSCNMITRLLRHVTSKAREMPTHDGTAHMEEAIYHCEKMRLEWKWHGVQPGALRATTTPGWNTHQETRRNGRGYRRQTRVQVEGKNGCQQ